MLTRPPRANRPPHPLEVEKKGAPKTHLFRSLEPPSKGNRVMTTMDKRYSKALK